jgi:prevent-host-death family protein
MRQVDVHEAKTELSRLLEAVESGERIVIARAGHPVAVLVPYKTAMRRRKLGQFPGQVNPDFDELRPDIAAAFGAS